METLAFDQEINLVTLTWYLVSPPAIWSRSERVKYQNPAIVKPNYNNTP